MFDLNSAVEFACPFVVSVSGVEDASYYVPTVYNDDESDIYVEGYGWEALTGYTGQYGYRGAVMHPSEYLGGKLAEDIMEDVGGVYVVTKAIDPDDPDNLIGWVVLKYVGEGS